jgi:hypothetical protein
MQTTRRLIILGLLTTVFTSVVLLTHVSADGSIMTDAQVTRIQANCVSAKTTLNQIHASDALLRVNRGQIYEFMTTKLMSPFNVRAKSNNLDTTDLVTTTNNYNTALTTFINDYKNYEEQLSTTLQIDCTKQPVAFYDSVTSARDKRSTVHGDVVALHQYIDSYSTAFDSIAGNFEQNKVGAQ